jgi:hypothetical protein
MKLSLFLITLLLPVVESRWRVFNGRLRGRRADKGNNQKSGQDTNEQGSGGNQGSSGGNQGSGGTSQGNQGSGGNKGNQGSGGNKGSDQGTQALPAATTPLSADEKEDILFMREEEKLARDVYLTLGDMYNVAVFGNIAKSEQQHMNSMKTLVDAYDLDDPVVDDTVGAFTHPTLQGYYDDLTQRGSQGLLEALKVGALIEEIDIEDLQLAIEEGDQSDADYVYERLLRGSFNHLRAFVRNIELQGEEYVPVKLSQAEYDAIVG